MGLFRRRPKLPADRRPALDREERILAWAAAGSAPADADVVVVTNRGLWLPGRADRLAWHDVHKAVWSGRELTVTPAEVVERPDGYLVVADLPAESYRLSEPGEVPHQVRTRVTASVTHSVHYPLAGGGVRVVARRVSGVDGLTWTVRYDPGTDPAPEQVAELVAAVRQETRPEQ